MALNANWTHAAALKGMAQAERAADPEWWRYMFALIIEIAQRKPYLFTDDIEAERRKRGGPETHEQRAMGPLMKAAKDAGIIAQTDHLVPGRWDKRVWASQIYRGSNQPPRPRRRKPIDPRQYKMLS